jgi:serine/threonine protein kinase
VIHRDNKPENILLHDGAPLLADFGIAVAFRSVEADRLTATGIAIGTPAYMSPEQIAGERALTFASDVYSLGAVAYEMCTGEPPIDGPSKTAILSRVMLESPRPIRSLRPDVPDRIDRSILRALAKNPKDRFDTAQAMSTALLGHGPPGQHFRRWHLPVALGIAMIALIPLLVASHGKVSRATLQRQLTFTGNAQSAALSPDGQFLAYASQVGDSQDVVVQDVVAGGRPDTLFSSSNIASLEWSPDGTHVLVGSYSHPLNAVAILPRLGGPPRYLNFPEASFANWVGDASHVSVHAIQGKRVLVIDLATNDTVSLAVRGTYTWMWQGSWSPSGRVFSVATQAHDPLRWQIRTLSRSGTGRVVAEDSVPLSSPTWSADGASLYFARASESIWRVRVSPATGERREEPEEVQSNLEALPVNYGALVFSVARKSQQLAYGRGLRFSNLWLVRSNPTNSEPETIELTRGTALRWSPVVSPDGKTIAFAQEVNGTGELWRMPIKGGASTQITVGARVWPLGEIAWSPDGSRLAFETLRAGHAEVWTADVRDGHFREFASTSMSTVYAQLTWAPGQRIAYLSPDHHDTHLLDPETGKEAILTGDTALRLQTSAPLRSTRAALWSVVTSARYSPDGRKLAVRWGTIFMHWGIWLFDLRDSTSRKISDRLAWVRGWSPDGRFVYGQFPTGGSSIYRFDIEATTAPALVVQLPFKEAQCTPAGRFRPHHFVCAAFDYTSDIWVIDNFDNNSR